MNRRVRAWIEDAWNSPPGEPPTGAWILTVASRLYALGVMLHRPRARRAPIPVVSIGSIWSGGAGKTPLTDALARIAAAEGLRPAIVMRGYRGEQRSGTAAIDLPLAADSVRRFGDEACLHARRGSARVYVSPDRLRGVEAAAEAGHRIALLDDGMQHLRLARDLEVVSLPASRPFANGSLLPRGPLREMPDALGRAHVVVLAHATEGDADEETHRRIRRYCPHAEILGWSAGIRVRALTGAPPVAGDAVGLVSGIARPGAFRQAVAAAGFQPAWEVAFEDHHAFTQDELNAVHDRAISSGVAGVLITEKDEMRLPGMKLGDRVAIGVADLELRWQTAGAEDQLRRRLCELLAR
jgi:tetraacyldisaccharide 4'-kinase